MTPEVTFLEDLSHTNAVVFLYRVSGAHDAAKYGEVIELTADCIEEELHSERPELAFELQYEGKAAPDDLDAAYKDAIYQDIREMWNHAREGEPPRP